MSNELAIREAGEVVGSDSFLMPAVPIEQMIERYNAIVELTKRVLKPGIDYGVIPGTERKNQDGTPSNKNNTLFKPGAEKLCTFFGLVSEFEEIRVIENFDTGLFYYAYRCKLTRSGRVVATGIGSANSREKKYRRESRVCPECAAPTIKRSRYAPKGAAPGTPPGWYCDGKGGGCGCSFEADDPAIVGQAVVQDAGAACDLVNTLQKMAQKRAHVAATLYATNASEFFTQDAEDMEIIDAEYQESKPRAAAAPPPPAPGSELMNDATFIAEAKAAAMDRGITPAEFEANFPRMIEATEVPLSGITKKGRQQIIDAITKGKADKWKNGPAGPAPTPESDPFTDAINGPPEQFKSFLLGEAKKRGHSRADVEAGLAKWLNRGGSTLETLTPARREELAEAVVANVLDWKTGQMVAAAA